MSVNSTLTGAYRNPNANLRCESLTCETLSVNNAIEQNVSDVANLIFPAVTHTFNANLNDVFLVDISFLASANFVNNTTKVLTITLNNLKPNTFIKASIVRVLDITDSIGNGYEMSVFINYQTEGEYLLYLNNKTGNATPFTGIVKLMLEQVVSK